MSRKILSACAAVLAFGAFATAAEARVDYGLVPSLYENNERSAVKPNMGKNFQKGGSTYARTKTRGYRKAGRHTGSRGASASRACLKASARSLLSRIENQFGPVQLISTCRPGAVIATSGKPSKHRYGLAIDFNAGSRKGAIVRWLVANHHDLCQHEPHPRGHRVSLREAGGTRPRLTPQRNPEASHMNGAAPQWHRPFRLPSLIRLIVSAHGAGPIP